MSVVENFNLHYDIAQPVKENYFNPKNIILMLLLTLYSERINIVLIL